MWTRPSNSEHARTYQIRQLLALASIQESVNLFEGPDQGLANLDRALNTALAGRTGFGSVERLAGNGVGKLGQRTAIVDFGLGSLGLEVIQDARQLGDLLFIEIEIVSQESEGPSNAKA